MNIRDYDLFTRLVRTRPVLPAAVLFLLGCMLGYALTIPFALSAAACIFSAAFALALRKHRRISAAVLVLMFIPLGMIRFDCAWLHTQPLPDQKNITLSGRICFTPDWNPETERTICVLEDFSIDGIFHKGRLRLYLRGDIARLQAVELGQEISCKAHIWEAEKATNPGEFNFSNYLRLNKLRGYATAEIEDAQLSPPSYILSDWPEHVRLALSERIDRLFPQNNALARAFLLGDRSTLSNEDRESYSISGAAHLLAISGMHVSMLAAAIMLLLRRFMNRNCAFFITLLSLLAYGILIGFPASLVRAIVMFAIYTAAPIFGRHSDGAVRIASAMLACLFLCPMAILDAGFILSYGASAGIILLSAPIKRLLHLEHFLSKRPGTGIKAIFTHRLPHWIAQSLVATIAAQIAILPAVIHFFGAQPVWSLFVNLAAVPLAMLAYVLSIIAAISGLAPIAAIPDFLFGLLTKCVQFFSSLPIASLHVARFPPWLVLLCAAACFFASDLSALSKSARRFLPLFVLLAVFISNGCALLSTRECSLVFLDAGEADCAVIRTEGKVYLVDTGDEYSPAADYLSAMNYNPDGIFLSHCHTDHAGGLADILKVTIPKRIYLSVNWNLTEVDESVSSALTHAAELGAEIIFLRSGDEIMLSDGTFMKVLYPSAGFQGNSANEDSMILRLQYGNCSALFTGDAPADIIETVATDVDILKIPHHGANDSLSAAMLMKTSPSAVVISTGYNNHGHPVKSVLKLLESADITIYRTDFHGAVTCYMNQDGSLQIRPYQTLEDFNGLE